MKLWRFAVALFVVAIFMIGVACGGSTVPASDGPQVLGPDASASDTCTELAQFKCAKRDSCTGGTYNARDFGDVSTCIARETLACSFGISTSDPASSVSTNEACVSQIQALSCTDFLQNNYGAPCHAPGNRATGDGCIYNANCASGFCTNNRFSVCGTCGTPPPAGASCATSNCGPNNACFWNSALVNICEPQVAVGGSCGENSTPGCGADLTCVRDSGSTTGVCAPALQTVGEGCGSSNMNINCDSTLGLDCTTTNQIETCTAITFLADGATCGTLPDGTYSECAAGDCWTPSGPFTTATYPTGTCKAFAADGAACDNAVGPECMTPARCVVGDAGSAGICTLLTPAVTASCQ